MTQVTRKIPENLAALQQDFEKKSAEEVLEAALRMAGLEHLALASSLSAEDQVLTAMILQIEPRARIFTLDTGRLPQETYDVMQDTMAKYRFHYEVLFPDAKAVEAMVSGHGPNLFYESHEKRLLCCRIRKVEPLRSYLAPLQGWITGIRRGQGITRTQVPKIEWDETFGLLKFSPLADWTEKQVWEFIRSRGVPSNKLHDRGYPSIGCAPCTRAVPAGEDPRAGRWWWENPEHKECGLHFKKRG